jgi:hypothetical protein
MIEPQLDEELPAAGDRIHRQFAAICLVVFGALAGVEVLAWGRAGWAAGFGVAALVAGVGGLIAPKIVAPMFGMAMAVATPIGRVTSRLLLAMVFYGVFTPIALVMRLVGYDGLKRRRRRAASYWVPKERPVDVRSYFRQ